MCFKLKGFYNIIAVLFRLLIICFCMFLIVSSQDISIPRTTAAGTLEKIKESVVKALIEALKDENHEVRKQAAISLGEINARHAVEPLIAALKDENPEVRKAAAWALGEIGKSELGPVKKFGNIMVNSNPPNAQVFLDGKILRSLTPTVIEKVTADEKHEIRVTKKGFKPWTRTVEVKADKYLQIEVILTKLMNTKKYIGTKHNWFTMCPVEMPKEPAMICTISIESTGKLYIGQKDGGVSIAVFTDEKLSNLWRTYSCFGPGGCYIDGCLNKWLIKVPVHSWIVVYFDEAGRSISGQKILGAIITDGLTDGDSYAPESPIEIVCNQGKTILVQIPPFGDDYLWETTIQIEPTEPTADGAIILTDMLPPDPED